MTIKIVQDPDNDRAGRAAADAAAAAFKDKYEVTIMLPPEDKACNDELLKALK